MYNCCAFQTQEVCFGNKEQVLHAVCKNLEVSALFHKPGWMVRMLFQHPITQEAL
jgi:hypothetical protein